MNTSHRIMKPKSIRIYFLLIIIVLIWGLSWPINKLGLTYVSPFWFAALRLVIGTVSMFILSLYSRHIIIPTVKDLPMIFSLGIFQIGLFVLMINLGLTLEPSGTAAILVYTTPLWVMPMSIFFFKESSSPLKWLGFILGFIGVLFMLNPAEINWSDSNTLLTLCYLMSASFALSIGILCARYMTWHHTPLQLIPWQLLLGSLLLLLVAFKIEPHPIVQWNLTSISCLAYTGVMATAIGFLGMAKISKELPATVTSIGFLGVPVSGVIFSVILLHESVGLYKILAMLFITLGVICVVCGERKEDYPSK